MNVETKYASPLKLKNLMITEGSVKRKEDSLEDIELGIQVNRDIENISENEYKITLELTVSDANEQITVYVKGVALFETKQENMVLIEKNTIAIMFPYLRSYISMLTTQPGMMPIVLPAMNIVAMLQDQS